MTEGRRLEGRVGIVTGASRGIGAAMAIAMAAEGARVVVAARTQVSEEALPGTIGEVVETIGKAGGEAIAVACDVAVDEDLVRLVETTRDRFGAIDILVNNAAATVPGQPGKRAAPPPPTTERSEATPRLPGIDDFPLRSIRKQFEINLFAPWRLMQLVAPAMREAGRGAILNISSESARMPGPPLAYGSSKIALEHVTASVAAELGPHGVAVSALAPSYPITTPGLTWVGAGDDAGSAEEFAEAAIRLLAASPETVGGRIHHHADVLEPGAPPRRWIGRIERD